MAWRAATAALYVALASCTSAFAGTAPPEAGPRPWLPPTAHEVFHDDFDATAIDPARWTTCYPWADPNAGCTNVGNDEQQWYRPSQVQPNGGVLHLVAELAATAGTDADGAPTLYPYRSGMIASAGRFAFTYGYIEFRARIPRGQAMWPALWLLPADFGWPPEIDVMEAVSQATTGVSLTLHGTDGSAPQAQVRGSGDDFAAGWHTYGVDWRPGTITWYVDGVDRFRVTHGVPDEPMYVLANLAVGGRGGGPLTVETPSRAEFDIDSITVWQT